jgi:glyoxylase-like metal-dependent hydrolase (beta-lactamase superfamily II)
VHELDADSVETGGREVLQDLFSSRFEKVRVDVKVTEGSLIDLNGLVLKVIHTPGHTRGSMCLIDESSGSLFSGDTVFEDGVGRTDLLGGSAKELSSSLRRLLKLAGEGKIRKVYPGHGSVFSGERIRNAGEYSP